MNLFQFNKSSFEVEISPEVLTIDKFKTIVNRDKNKNKSKAIKELSLIYLYVDVRSDYMYITDEEQRLEEIKHDLDLPKDWKIDKTLEEAINLYKERSITVNSALYKGALVAANAVNEVCMKAKEHIKNAEDPITAAQKITGILEKIPKAMANLSAAYQELIKEQRITEGRSKGSRVFNMYEDGLDDKDE